MNPTIKTMQAHHDRQPLDRAGLAVDAAWAAWLWGEESRQAWEGVWSMARKLPGEPAQVDDDRLRRQLAWAMSFGEPVGDKEPVPAMLPVLAQRHAARHLAAGQWRAARWFAFDVWKVTGAIEWLEVT